MSLETSSGAVRIRTTEQGLYRLTYPDLLAAGVPLGSVDPRSFVMTNRGQPVQIQVTGEADGTFDPGDRVIFYAGPYLDRYTTQNIYRLYWAQQPAPPFSRMGTRMVAPTGAEPIVSAITQTTHIEFDRSYYSDYPLSQDTDHWFDDPLYPSSSTPTVVRSYTLALDDPLTAGNVQVRAQLYGGQDAALSPDQSVKLWLNSHEVDTWQWDGRVGYLGQATAPAAWLDEAPNALKLEAGLSQLPGLSEYWVYPDWVRVSYPAQPNAEGDRLVIEGIDVPGPTMQITVTGFTTATVRIYDVRRPREPVQLLASEAISDGVSYALHFADAVAAGEPPARYALSADDALLAPAAVEPDTLTTWTLAPQTADYIAIVHCDLWDAVQPLLDHRAAQGLRVAKVDVQDIYDEISYGFVGPEAIRTFLSYAYANWKEGEAPPRYVLLVGGGHYDFRGVSGTTLPNLIPPYLIHIDPWIGETAADNRYVSVDSPDDYLPDMAIGRIPARHAADLTAVVDKILAYEDPAQAPDGDWQNKAVFVADNYADSAGNFHALSDKVRTNWLAPNYDTSRIYYRLDASLDTADEMRAAIKQAYNDRAVYLQWFGHASRFRWGSVSMFNVFDPPNLAPNTQLPLTAHYSCWTGYFVNLGNNWQSLAEQLVIQPGRGSIADFAPSGLHIGSALLDLNRGLALALFRDRIREVGDATTQAKLYYFANSTSWHDVIDTQILFGDPALPLRVPATPPTPPTVAIAARGADAVLSWPHSLDAAQYEVWRDMAPYFEPDAAVLVTTQDAGFVGAGASFEFADDGASPPPPAQVIGDPAANYFWVLRSRNGDGVSELSNRVGEFDFALVPGE
ncbi:MAG: C25 family cysteine peptidase [Anaerolineae bacterium]